MIKGMKLMLVLLVMIGLVGMVAPVFSQEKVEKPQATFVSGEVVSVDLVKSIVVIKQIKDPVAGTYEIQPISGKPEIKITQGDKILKLSELKVGDNVKVKYATDSLGTKNVESISVETK